MASRILVSACLLGAQVRHDGGAKTSDHATLREWVAAGRVVSVCPEVEGGLAVPRPPAEIRAGAGGLRVLRGEAVVATNGGRDVTREFIAGAETAVRIAREHGIRVAVLKANSPSCGSGWIYDGTFTGARVPGQGVAAAALTRAGVRVFSEEEIHAAAAFLATLDGETAAQRER